MSSLWAEQQRTTLLPYSLHSPGTAPCAFGLFPKMKAGVASKTRRKQWIQNFRPYSFGFPIFYSKLSFHFHYFLITPLTHMAIQIRLQSLCNLMRFMFKMATCLCNPMAGPFRWFWRQARRASSAGTPKNASALRTCAIGSSLSSS